ncbi:MAG: hypothetical protein COA78_31385 [Blastopirellula sp.]|nr:MAG: hypothetical protein COA78_31385 [Blastopirellula sp.]
MKEQSPLQKLACTENWSLAQLHCTASVLSRLCRHPFVSDVFKSVAANMRDVIHEEIQLIKQNQRLRMGRCGHYTVTVDGQTHERDTESEVWQLYFRSMNSNGLIVDSPSDKDLSVFRGMSIAMDTRLDNMTGETNVGT